MKMTKSLHFPDDVLYEIFSHLDFLQIAKIESVCKQWKEVARNNKTLWKNGLFIDDREIDIQYSYRIYDRLMVLLERSGGIVESLYLPFTGKIFSEIDKICRFLPQTKIENLWIYMDRFENMANESGCSNKVLDSIYQCSNLKSLHLDLDFDIGLQAPFSLDVSGKPVANCRLERLTYSGYSGEEAERIFGVDFKKMISTVKVLHLYPIIGTGQIHSRAVFDLLQSIKDTLEQCAIPYTCVNIGLGDGPKEVILPKLSTLRIAGMEDQGFQRSTERPFILKCPNLRDLTLDSYSALHTSKHLLKRAELEVLRLIIPQPAEYFTNKTFANSLQKLKSLRCLILIFDEVYYNQVDTQEFLKRFNESSFSLSIEKLTLYNLLARSGTHIIQFLKARIDEPTATKIKNLQIYSKEEPPIEVSFWLSHHVEKYEYHSYTPVSQQPGYFTLREGHVLRKSGLDEPIEFID